MKRSTEHINAILHSVLSKYEREPYNEETKQRIGDDLKWIIEDSVTTIQEVRKIRFKLAIEFDK